MSQSDRYSKCRCKNCGGHIEFPGGGAGSTVPCPHCNWPTILADESATATAPTRSGPPKRKLIYRVFVIGATVAIAGGAGFYRYWYLPNSQHTAAPVEAGRGQPIHGGDPSGGAPSNPAPPAVVVHVPPPDPWHGLMAGPVILEKVGDGNLVYAVGKLRNQSDHQRFGVKVELDVFDDTKEKVGTATDYTPSIDPGKEWKFRALVTDRTAATAKLTAVKEN